MQPSCTVGLNNVEIATWIREAGHLKGHLTYMYISYTNSYNTSCSCTEDQDDHFTILIIRCVPGQANHQVESVGGAFPKKRIRQKLSAMISARASS